MVLQRRPNYQWPESTLEKSALAWDLAFSIFKLGFHLSVVQKLLAPGMSVADSPEMLKRAGLRGNDLCSLLSGLARRFRGAPGRPSLGRKDGSGREWLTYMF